jgi:hypothetical protein
MTPHLTIIQALLFLLAVTAAWVQTPPAPATGTGEIYYTLYGRFIMPAHAVRQLVLTPDTATFTMNASAMQPLLDEGWTRD